MADKFAGTVFYLREAARQVDLAATELLSLSGFSQERARALIEAQIKQLELCVCHIDREQAARAERLKEPTNG